MLEVDVGQLPKLRFGQLLLVGEEARIDGVAVELGKCSGDGLSVAGPYGPDGDRCSVLELVGRRIVARIDHLLALRADRFCRAPGSGILSFSILRLRAVGLGGEGTARCKSSKEKRQEPLRAMTNRPARALSRS